MGRAGQQRPQDRQRLGPVLQADVHVGAEDEHLMPPQARAVHQPRVALGVRHLLHQGVGEGVGAGAGQIHAQRLGHRQEPVEGQRYVLQAFSHGAPRSRYQLDGVEHHLAVDVRVGPHCSEDLGRALAQVEAVAVDQLELPLHSECGALGMGEGQGLTMDEACRRAHGGSSMVQGWPGL